MKKFLLTCLMLFVALSLFAGGSGEKKGNAVEEVVIAVPALPATMEPGDNSNQTVAMYKVFMNMYDTLIKIDYKNNTGIKPGLAESWKRIDDTTLELYLRKGVKFHDGSDFTADDVVCLFGPRRPFSKDSIMGKDKNFPNFKEVQKIDDYTVRIITKKPDPTIPFESNYLENDHEAIVSSDVWDAVQKKLEENKKMEEVVGHRGGQPHFLYGKVFCECGAPMTRRTVNGPGGQRIKTWVCRDKRKGTGCKGRNVKEEELLKFGDAARIVVKGLELEVM